MAVYNDERYDDELHVTVGGLSEGPASAGQCSTEGPGTRSGARRGTRSGLPALLTRPHFAAAGRPGFAALTLVLGGAFE